MTAATESNLNLGILDQAVDLVRLNAFPVHSKEASLIRVYPRLLRTAQSKDAEVLDTFLLLATLAHGWLPHSLQIEEEKLPDAVDAFDRAREENRDFSLDIVESVANCLQSLVAASRVLHFANPYRYPTWGPAIEHFRLGRAPSPYHMMQTANYGDYVRDVQRLKGEEGFLGFHHAYCMNYQQRLRRLAIPPYPLTDMRVIESAVYEILRARKAATGR